MATSFGAGRSVRAQVYERSLPKKGAASPARQVASIESQLTTLKRTFGDNSDSEVVGVYEDSFSAKEPGRPQFGEMLAQIEKAQLSKSSRAATRH
ncbi:recombinase family protein [Bradyrhizobium sp. CCBAU 11357]|uniref:recombinase family protein n=1 Tax=Bradyrhizobium sp. CCBAU 11357 TaxID=1630808 RepID=UPI003FA40653